MMDKNSKLVYVKWLIFGFFILFIPLFLSQGMNLFNQTIQTIFGEMNILLFILIIDLVMSLLPLYIIYTIKNITNEK